MPRRRVSSSLRRISTAAVLSCAALTSPLALAYESPFVTAVVRTSPIAYFRLETSDGQGGAQSYHSRGPVRIEAGGVDPGSKSNSYAKFNGHGAFIETTQRGGVGRAASLMAWVNLDKEPAEAHRILYVAGISQAGNDFDLQFEQDNTLRFYTGAGSHLTFTPDPSSLAGQWHMIVATFDVDRRTRALYWDGALVASDDDAGRPGKIGQLTIGASAVWGGRFFEGGIDEVALWNKALSEEQVANFYSAATSGAMPPPSKPAAAAAITTTAQVEVEDDSGKVALKPEEKVAVMFLAAIQAIQGDCQMHGEGACTLDQMLEGPRSIDNWHINRLKYDPAGDPNYTYTVKVNGKAWEAHADPKRPGLAGFYYYARFGSPDAFYNPSGPAGAMDRQLTSRSIMGDSFSVR